MIFYEIKLNSAPEVIFACNVESYNHKNSFPYTSNLLEISVCEKSEFLLTYEDGLCETIVPGTMLSIIKDARLKISSACKTLQKHTTVGIIADYEYTKLSSDNVNTDDLKKSTEKKGTILIPYILALNNDYDKIINLMTEISHTYTSVSPTRKIGAISGWYKLAEFLTDMVLNEISGNSKKVSLAAINYINCAKDYIKENYKTQITIEDIANYVGISAGYLHNIFKTVTNMSVIEYINLYKINLVKQFVKSSSLTLKEATYMVGFDDPAYMSRMFKKVTGMSFREYSQQINRSYQKAD